MRHPITGRLLIAVLLGTTFSSFASAASVTVGTGVRAVPIAVPGLGTAGTIGSGAPNLSLSPSLKTTLSVSLIAAPAPALSPSLVPTASALTPEALAALPEASAQLAPALSGLQALDASVAQAQDQGGSASQASISATFDGVTSGNGGNSSVPPAVTPQSDSFIERLAGLAKSLYFPQLKPDEAAPVAISYAPKGSGTEAIPSDETQVARMKESPLTNPQREAAIIRMFQEAGASANVVRVAKGQVPPLDVYDTVIVQDAGRGHNNIYVVKKGKTDRVIVDSSHNDKVSEGQGTIDNWSGSMMVVGHYQGMREFDSESTHVFIAFAREEEGLIGSETFLQSMTEAQKKRIFVNQNLDTLAVDGTFSWKNNSTRWVLDLIKSVASEKKLGLQEIRLDGGDADSSSFLHRGIAAMTVFGVSPEVIFDIIHSANDNFAAFSLPHFKNAYLLTLEVLKALDRLPAPPKGSVQPVS